MDLKIPSCHAREEKLANRIRQAPRSLSGKTRGLTQVQLAEATGMTQSVISYYETEAELPPAHGAHSARQGPGSLHR